MAKFGINQEGVDSLNQLAKDLSTVNNDIEDNGKKLKSVVTSLGDDLGIYEEPILDVIDSVDNSQKKGRESIETLSNKVKKTASDVQNLINAGF